MAQKTSNPTQYDWNELKRVVKYLKGTAHFKLEMAQSNQTGLFGYADANWAENRTDRKSNSGYVFKLNGGTISWCSKKQVCVALSSTEAELIALTEGTKEAVWIHQLLSEIGQPIDIPIVIFEDNQSCLKLIDNVNASNRTKHIDVRHFFIRDYIEKRIIVCEYCPTDEMTADILTKPLSKIKFEKLRLMLGIHD